MRTIAQRPIRPSGWAFHLIALTSLLLTALPLFAQYGGEESAPVHHTAQAHHEHGVANDWEGSPEGKAYSEFNHHLAAVFVLLIGLSELRQGLALPFLTWTRVLLPAAMLIAGIFLLIWSDHKAWPIGSMSLAQTLFGGDWEILQHKIYGLLLLAVGTIEWLRRSGRIAHGAWLVPLPAFAIIGGLMLFGHMHGAHPSAQKIAIHHAIMGSIAVTAGSSKLMSGWQTRQHDTDNLISRSYWELLWAGLILLIGVQLLIYSE
ncbi:MAG: hypothetical protein ACT4OO_00335 [Nitrospiraceae bacterium]